METLSNNGIAVRGLRVLLSSEEGFRPRWWMWVLSLLLSLVATQVSVTRWSVVIVYDGSDNTVARRRFARSMDAENVRKRFVQLVADMSQNAYERADWQVVLDGCPDS